MCVLNNTMSDSDCESFSSDTIEREIIQNYLDAREQDKAPLAVKRWIKKEKSLLPGMNKVNNIT